MLLETDRDYYMLQVSVIHITNYSAYPNVSLMNKGGSHGVLITEGQL